MTEHTDEPTLDDVMETREQAVPDHREHAKQPKHLDEGELEKRTDIERDEVHEDRDEGSTTS